MDTNIDSDYIWGLMFTELKLGVNVLLSRIRPYYLSPESGGFFSDKCEMCQIVVGANYYIFNDIYKWRATEILSRI